MRVERSMMAGHRETPLVVRASLPRTFRGLGVFVEGCLIFTGAYLLSDVWKSPLEARQESVIGAGVLLSLAAILLFYLARPKWLDALARAEERGADLRRENVTAQEFDEPVQGRSVSKRLLEETERLPGPM